MSKDEHDNHCRWIGCNGYTPLIIYYTRMGFYAGRVVSYGEWMNRRSCLIIV
ncbi:MAG: hypothetical protein KGK14_09795 [Bacteroidota bacterium]|nr:hypothetical protein [Bacteroidota bacterium]